jgi:hypothetical protein
MACTKLLLQSDVLRPIAGGIALRTGAGAVFTNFGGKCYHCGLVIFDGMDRGSDFECEFRARRIRVRGNFAHKLFYEIIHRRYAHEMYAYKIHVYEIHAYEVHAHEIYAYEMHAYETHA